MSSSNKMKVVCPSCKELFIEVSKGIRCQKCHIFYPEIEKDLFALTPEPDKQIALAYLSFHRAAKQWQRQANNLSQNLKKSERKKELLPLIKAYTENKDFFHDWRDKLTKFVDIPTLLDCVPEQKQVGYGYNYTYITRDWSGLPEHEAEIKHAIGPLKKALNKIDATKKNQLLLGAGTGRYAIELAADYPNICAIESSLGQVGAFRNLLNEPINYWQISTKNQRTDDTILKKISAQISPELLTSARRINNLWADVLKSPFDDHAFDSIISIYFSDVIPLPKLIDEVKRLLTPGGYFIHLGPLQYHFSDITQHYSYEAFKKCFINMGFNIEYESELTPLTPDRRDLSMKQYFIDKLMIARLIDTND